MIAWKIRSAAVLGTIVLSCANAAAVTLDWNVNNTFTQGQTNSYEVDPQFAGNDISIAISTANLGSGTMTAAVASDNEGGLGPGHNSLGMLMNFSTTGQFITVTVTFNPAYSQGVTGVSFKLFDVDMVDDSSNGAGSIHFEDQIRSITATTVNNTTVGATITTGPANTRTGTGTNQAVNGIANSLSTGTTSSDGNVTIDFGTNVITSFSFVYGSGTTIGTGTDPTDQKIGMYNINFTPVPEMNPTLSAVVSCVLAAGLVFHHRSRVRARRK